MIEIWYIAAALVPMIFLRNLWRLIHIVDIDNDFLLFSVRLIDLCIMCFNNRKKKNEKQEQENK